MHTTASSRPGLNTATLTRRRALSCLSACALAGLLQACDPGAPAVVKIGVAQPLSGELAARGQDMLNGVILAVEELNQAGFTLRGKPVKLEVVSVDDASNPEQGVKVAHQLVDAKVAVVIGHLNSGVSIPAAPVYAQAHIPQLAISTNPKYTALGLPTTFRLVANDNLQAKAMGRFAVESFNATRFAVLDDGTPYGKDLAAGAVAQLQAAKKEVVLQQTFGDKSKDFSAVVARMKALQVQALITTLDDFQVEALLPVMEAAGLTDIPVLGGDTLKSPLMLKKAHPMPIFATSGILEARDFPNGTGFIRKYQARFNTEVAYGSHYTYDAMYQVAAAMRRVDSADPQKITEALRQIDSYVPVTGYMKWNEQGEQTYSAVAAYKVVRGKWESQIRSSAW